MSNFSKAVSLLRYADLPGRTLHPRQVEAIVTALQSAGLLAPDAEEYQYGVFYIGVNHGGEHIEWLESTGDAERDKRTLQRIVHGWKKRGQSPEIVRRRVSPPEVVNETN